MAFNILYYDNNTNSLREATTSLLDQLSEYILEQMASGSFAGTIDVGNTGSTIGTFTDTVRQGGVGSQNISVLSNSYTLSQLRSVQRSNNPPEYLGLNISNNQVIIQESATSLNNLADEIIDRMLDRGPNSYFLGTSAPNDGGTWVSRGSLADTLQNFNITNSNYRLWHKITSPTYTSLGRRPLKLGSSGLIEEFSNTEIENIIRKVEERIIATGRGYYALQSSAPSSGTWVSEGTVTDVRRNTTNVTYTGNQTFVGNRSFAGNYLGNYIGNYDSSGKSVCNYAGNYVGNYIGNYAGTRNYVGTRNYTAAEVSSSTSNISSVTLWKRIS